MKKIILISFLSLSVNLAKAQIDTAVVLNHLIASKSFYIGKQAQLLINSLPLEIKFYLTPLPLPNLPDTLAIKDIDLSFISLDQTVNNISKGHKCPRIVIYFTTPIQTPKKIFNRGYILDATGKWTASHSIYFGQAIVADFKIYGY